MSELGSSPPHRTTRRWVSHSEPISLDGQTPDDQGFHRQQSYLGAGREPPSYSRSHSPLMHAHTASGPFVSPYGKFREVMSPLNGPRQPSPELRPVMSPFAGSSQEESPMTDYFPPVELLKPTYDPNKALHALTVGNLDPSMTTERLTTMFETVQGFIPSFTTAKIMEHPQTKESLGYAIAYFGDERDQQ